MQQKIRKKRLAKSGARKNKKSIRSLVGGYGGALCKWR
jgi:hypothetical protein